MVLRSPKAKPGIYVGIGMTNISMICEKHCDHSEIKDAIRLTGTIK